MARIKQTGPVVRRSPRAPARVKVKFNEPSTPVAEKRKRSVTAGKDNTTVVPVVASTSRTASQSPFRKKSKDDKVKDRYCWLCHQEGDDQACNVCLRVFHYQCLGPANRFTEEGLCPECRQKSTDGTDANTTLTMEKLSELLPLALNRMLVNLPLLKSWPCSDEDNKSLACIMDLSILEDRLNTDIRYESTADFFADVKWILHNCQIIYGPNHNLTITAKKLVKATKMELTDIEACPECYSNANTYDEEFFSKVCSEPHTLVWAKLKGFPFWPAKVLKVIDGVADVRFFGSHEKGKVPVAQCFLLSEDSPTGKVTKHANFAMATKELNQYIRNVVDQRGKFQYASPRTVYTPGEANHITKSSLKKNTTPKDAKEKRPGSRGRPSKKGETSATLKEITVVPVEPMPKTVIDLIDVEQEETTTEAMPQKEVEIIGEQRIPSPAKTMLHKQNFLNHLELSNISQQWVLKAGLTSASTSMGNEPVANRMTPHTAVEMVVSPPLSVGNGIIESATDLTNEPGICMDFCVEGKDSEENTSESVMDFQVDDGAIVEKGEMSIKENIQSLLNDLLDSIPFLPLANKANAVELINSQMIDSVTVSPTEMKDISTKVSPTRAVITNAEHHTSGSSFNSNFIPHESTSTPLSQVFVTSSPPKVISHHSIPQSLGPAQIIHHVCTQPSPVETIADCSSINTQLTVASNSEATSAPKEVVDLVDSPTKTVPKNLSADSEIVTNLNAESPVKNGMSHSLLELPDVEIIDEPVVTHIITHGESEISPNQAVVNLNSACGVYSRCHPEVGLHEYQTEKDEMDHPQIVYSIPASSIEVVEPGDSPSHENTPMKYVNKLMESVRSTFTEMWNDINNSLPNKSVADLYKEIEALREFKTKQNIHLDEIKSNTDLIIASVKGKLEVEKQRAVDMAKKLWEEEKAKEIAEIIAKLEKSFEEERKKFKQEKEEVVLETKKSQWCAFCKHVASFYCCWNTSYCGTVCQENDWAAHYKMCEHVKPKNSDRNTEDEVEVPQPEKYYGAKKARKSFPNHNLNGVQALPSLRANGQSVFRFVNSGQQICNIQPMQNTQNLMPLPQNIRLVGTVPRQVYSSPTGIPTARFVSSPASSPPARFLSAPASIPTSRFMSVPVSTPISRSISAPVSTPISRPMASPTSTSTPRLIMTPTSTTSSKFTTSPANRISHFP